MADILGGSPVTTNGNGASTTRRPTAPPAQTGSPSRGGVPGPVDIMRKRQERERQKREKEEMQTLAELKKHEQELASKIQDDTRYQQQQAAGAGMGGRGGGRGGGGGGGGVGEDPQLDAMTQRRQQRAQESAAQQAGRTAATATSSSRVPSGNQPAQPPLRATRVPTGQTGQMTAGALPTGGGQPGSSVQPNEGAAAASASVARTSRNSFPHAFERWEALSAHWEGMTSFWIRKLQENTQELDRNAVSAQLSRQVSDLSAAGANLFHAVVELQRLRASSERKFQRWFFETRAELERNQEEKATLQQLLDEERASRQAAIEEAVGKSQETAQVSNKTLKQLSEMRKELMISKEEARRAWEELGRREQEERDRTMSLQQGLATIVGGVQVVPMTQGVPSRQTSTHDQQQQQQQRPQTRGDDGGYGSSQASAYQGYSQSPSQQQQQPPSSVSGGGLSQGSGSDPRYYQQQQRHVDSSSSRANYSQDAEDNFSEEGQEYVIDDHGRYVLDSQGKKILFRSPLSAASTLDPQPASQPPVTSYPPSSSQWAYSGGQGGGQSSNQQPDYAGRDYAAPGWENVPSHHHPTRLSDVIEEDDERSRGSASLVSRA